MTRISQRTRYIDLALVLAAIGLGTYLASTSGGPTSEESLARENNLLTAFSPETVRTIILTAPKSKVTLRKVEADPDPHLFFLGEKGQLPADPAVVAELFSTLEYATWLRTLASNEDIKLSQLGFETPRLELRLNADAHSHRLLIGAPAPFPPGSVYARVQDNHGDVVTGVVNEQLLSKLLREEQEFRGNALFLYGRSETSSLTIEKQNEKLELRADTLGFLTERETPQGPDQVRAERSLSDLIFFQMARASITSFIDPEFAKKNIIADPHHLTVTQKSSEAPSVNVQMGGKCPGDEQATLAIRLLPDVVAGCVTRTILPALRLSPQALVDLTAAPLNADEIDHVIIRSKRDHEKHETKLDLIRSDDAFSLLSQKSERVELKAGQDFLEVLSTGVLELVEGRPADANKSGEIVIKGQSLTNGSQAVLDSENAHGDPLVQELHLELFRPIKASGEDALWIHRLDDDAWLKVPPPLRWAFEADDSWAKDRHLVHFKPEQVQEVTITNAGGWSQTWFKDGSLAQSGTDERIAADAVLSRRLLDELSHLEAVRFIGGSPEKEAAQLEISFSVLEGAPPEQARQVKTLWIGKRTRGGYLAWSDFVSGLFVVSLPTQAIFNATLGSRAPLQVDLPAVTRLTATAAERRYVFERRGDALRPAGGGAVDDMVEPLEETIRGLDVLARMMGHPDSLSLKRGKPRASLKIELESGEAFTLHIGELGSWQGMNAHIAWREGEQENFVIGKSSVDALLNLL